MWIISWNQSNGTRANMLDDFQKKRDRPKKSGTKAEIINPKKKGQKRVKRIHITV